MNRFSKIVVGVRPPSQQFDGDRLDQPTVEAIATAQWLAESNHNCHIIFVSATTTSDDKDHVASLLEDITQTFHNIGVDTTVVFPEGKPSISLLTIAAKTSADLIIVGTRPASRASTVTIGSTAMRLFQDASIPIWCVKPGRIGLEWIVAAADDLQTSLGEEVLECGVEIALRRHAGMVAVHAVESHAVESHAVESHDMANDAHQACSRALLNRLAMTDFRSVPRGVRPHIAAGQAADVLESVVGEYDVDLLVIGLTSQTRTGIGDTPFSLLPTLHCSVLGLPAETRD